MNRGDRREPIFSDDVDRLGFIEVLGEVCGKGDWQVHAHCLMLNHFHLVVETPAANLVAVLRCFLPNMIRHNLRSVSEKWVERETCPLRRATSPPETGRQVAARDRLVACSTNFQTGS